MTLDSSSPCGCVCPSAKTDCRLCRRGGRVTVRSLRKRSALLALGGALLLAGCSGPVSLERGQDGGTSAQDGSTLQPPPPVVDASTTTDAWVTPPPSNTRDAGLPDATYRGGSADASNDTGSRPTTEPDADTAIDAGTIVDSGSTDIDSGTTPTPVCVKRPSFLCEMDGQPEDKPQTCDTATQYCYQDICGAPSCKPDDSVALANCGPCPTCDCVIDAGVKWADKSTCHDLDGGGIYVNYPWK